ncbi:hypothetical protein D0C36_22050 [Mucilaginibacter conchicola]|uniref:Uncharacterized protein n=1 Tax=Mucilaginibacter conchicola TaxID=2303333 RepID=A0A372NNF4_9SPHI|nr:hypothetical protein [Mucilaginibacter conchicola]RFZ90469.1 hypothetical protein D0C36_22050 [Mucilaginibacter conchicola]
MLKKIWRWLTGVTAKIKNSLLFGKDMANTIKSVADSPLLDIIVALTPTGLDDVALASFRKFMNDMVEKLSWADKIISEADQQEKTIVLHTLSAIAALWKADNEHSGLSLQTTLSTAQLVYDESKVDMSL